MYKDRKSVAAYDGNNLVGVFPSIRQAGWYMYLTGEANNVNSASANICRSYKTGKSAFGYSWKRMEAGDEDYTGLILNIKYNRMVSSGEIPSGNPAVKSSKRRTVELYDRENLVWSYKSISQAVREAGKYIPEEKMVWLRYSLNGYYDNTGITRYKNFSWKVK